MRPDVDVLILVSPMFAVKNHAKENMHCLFRTVMISYFIYTGSNSWRTHQ